MNKIILCLLISPILFFHTNCATIFTGTTENISFSSNVQGAVVEMDGVEVGRTPHTMQVKKSFNGTMSIKADGYQRKSFGLQKSFNGVSILNFFNLVFWGIDIATGAINKFDQKGYNITLQED